MKKWETVAQNHTQEKDKSFTAKWFPDAANKNLFYLERK